MTAAFEIREIGDDDWPKWSRFFARDFPGEHPSIGELVCKNSPIASVPQTLRNMVMF
jgi:hypothetical protein